MCVAGAVGAGRNLLSSWEMDVAGAPRTGRNGLGSWEMGVVRPLRDVLVYFGRDEDDDRDGERTETKLRGGLARIDLAGATSRRLETCECGTGLGFDTLDESVRDSKAEHVCCIHFVSVWELMYTDECC